MPEPARAATTVFYVEPSWNPGETPYAVSFQANTQVQLAKGQTPPVFTTGSNEEITLYPLADANTSGRFRTPGVKLTVGRQDRTADLAQGRAPALLGPDGSDTTIVLSLSASAAAPSAGTLALLFDLLTPPGINPAWSPDAVSNPPGPGTLTWLSRVNGALTPIDPTKVVDDTLGLRRSGIVRLPIPDNWTAEPGTKADYAVVLRGSNAGWTSPPRVSRIIPNVVSATHERPTTAVTTPYIQSQVQKWRRLPGNVFVLPEADRPALADTLVVTITATWRSNADHLETGGRPDRLRAGRSRVRLR